MNRVRLLQKIVFTAGISLATALTFSCSDDGGDGSGPSGPITEAYTLVEFDESSFTYKKTYENDYDCTEGGKLVKDTSGYNNTVNYSIDNNILVWEERWSDDTLNFKGTSSTLTGTWTRTKNKAASCKMRTEEYCIDYDYDEHVCKEYEEESWLSCKEGYDIVKAEFTQNNVKITHDYCMTDRVIIGESWHRNWKISKVDGCDSYELSNGTEKVAIKLIGMHGGQATYNGKTCKDLEPSKSKREKACKDAWSEIQAQGGNADRWELQEAYYEFLDKDFYECIAKNNFPAELFGDYDDDYYERAALAKNSSNTPKPKKNKLFGFPRR
ncbi:MAG: hypothetical protein LBB36_00875 [Fibromonadaceae bacterium]|jgi:hypothetical protein|nr:hypothetical protein [Fibromonadaceae bacterium]